MVKSTGVENRTPGDKLNCELRVSELASCEMRDASWEFAYFGVVSCKLRIASSQLQVANLQVASCGL